MRLDERAPFKGDEPLEDFRTRMQKELYRQECAEGARFYVPGFTNRQLKEVWR